MEAFAYMEVGDSSGDIRGKGDAQSPWKGLGLLLSRSWSM